MVNNLSLEEYRSWGTFNLEQLILIGQRELGNPEVRRELVKAHQALSERAYPEPVVCPHEDCPKPVPAGAPDCGSHEEWMTWPGFMRVFTSG